MSRSLITILIVLLLVALIAAIVLTPDQTKVPYQPMGTYCRMVIFPSDSPEDGNVPLTDSVAARNEIDIIEDLASTYRSDSEISRLANIKPGTSHPLSPEMYAVFERSLYYSRLTNGAFDVTVGPLMKLWREAAQSDTLPTSDQIATVLKAVGYRNISLDAEHRTITLSQAQMSITLDGIVKGILGGITAVGLNYAGYVAINQIYTASFFNLGQALVLVLFGTALGFLASAASVARHLRKVTAG